MSDCHDDGTPKRHRNSGRSASSVGVLDRLPQLALIGSPNAGKTTLFNALSGMRAKTANYPGVTVTRREAVVQVEGREILLVDLPGTYSLSPLSPDEQVVADALEGRLPGVRVPDGLVIVADATSLPRSLLLVGQVLGLQIPACLVLTMVDEVTARGGAVDAQRLSQALGIPVIGVIGHRGIGVDRLRELLADPQSWERPVLDPPTQSAQRAAWVDSIVASTTKPLQRDARTRSIDAVLLNPIAGALVFLVVMLAFFQAIFTLAAPVQGWIESLFNFFASGVRDGLPGFLGDFVADGIIAGVGGVLVFLPQIAMLFLIISFLEKVGYLARAAFLADRVMGRFGLEGRSFVAMLSSFACAVPGIMSTRTIPSERRRIATMMSAPLMTCSARLPVFTLLISGFIPNQVVLGPLRAQGLALFGLYALGVISGLLYALVLNLTGLRDTGVPFLMELPPYRRPRFRDIALGTWAGASSFIKKAGTVILVTSMGLWVLLHVPLTSAPKGMSEPQVASYKMERSVAGRLGKGLEPVFAPLGFDWRTNVAIIGSLSAREVFVSTLALTTASENETSLPETLRELRDERGRKIYDPPTVAALLVFFVYALQCLSTIAVLRRETNSWRCPTIAFTSMFAMAYLGALLARVVVKAYL
jgi:ferrous iron transport protein B